MHVLVLISQLTSWKVQDPDPDREAQGETDGEHVNSLIMLIKEKVEETANNHENRAFLFSSGLPGCRYCC